MGSDEPHDHESLAHISHKQAAYNPEQNLESSSKDGKFLFLELPAEIRISIYNYVYEGAFVSVRPCRVGHGWHDVFTPLESQRWTSGSSCDWVGHEVRPRFCVGHRRRSKSSILWHLYSHQILPILYIIPEPGLNFSDVNLMRTCRTVCTELHEIVYRKTVFSFSEPSRVRMALGRAKPKLGSVDVAPFTALQRTSIRSICIQMRAWDVEEDDTTDNSANSDLYYSAWQAACQLIVSELPKLESVSMFIHLPSKRYIDQALRLGAPWTRPALEFGAANKLRKVTVTLISRNKGWERQSPEVLNTFAEVLRRKASGSSDDEAMAAIKHSLYLNGLVGQSKKTTLLHLATWNHILLSEEEVMLLPGVWDWRP